MTSAAQVAPLDGVAEPVREDSVDQALRIVGEISDENRAAGRHLDTKAGSVAGFAAVTLALNSSLSAPLLREDLGQLGEPAIHVAFAVATLSLLAAALTALAGVLSPKKTEDIALTQIEAFTRPPYTTTDPATVRRWWLERTAQIATADRKANRRRVTGMKWAIRSLYLAVVAITAEAILLGATA